MTANGTRRKMGNFAENTAPRVKVDPSALGMPRKQVVQKDRTREASFADLDAAIKRKHEEAEESLRRMDEMDHKNRIAVAEGLETVDGNIVYRAQTEEEKATEAVEKVDIRDLSDEDFDKELERELDETSKNIDHWANDEDHAKNVVIAATMPWETEDASENNYDEQLSSEDEDTFDEDTALEIEQEIDQDQAEDDGFSIESDRSEATESYDDINDEELVDEKVEPKEEKMEEKQETEEEDTSVAESMFTNNTVTVKPESTVADTILKDVSKDDFDIDPEDFEDVDELSKEEADKKKEEKEQLRKRALNQVRTEVLNKIVNTANKLNVSTFSVSKKTASLNDVLKKSKLKKENNVKSTATWALLNVQRPFMCSALNGPEIVMIYNADETTANSGFTANVQQLKILYNHDENPYKPSTFEAWCKTIPYADIDELFMAAYAATFNKANYLPYSCGNDKCMNMELKDQPNIRETMVRFKNDAMKKKFDEIIETPLTPSNSTEYDTVIVPINDTIAIGFKLPSIYNMLLELRSVSQSFLQKYAAIITIITYIDVIYMINEDTGEFNAIDYKKYPGDVAKTFKSKIATYARILNLLSTNEFNILITYTNSIGGKQNDIHYFIPESKCEKCGSVIPEQEYTGKELLFTQQRLVDIVVTTIE